MLNKEEIEFYNKIKNNCKIIFDVGCRDDIEYIENSKNKIFHLFEPNPIFYIKCQEKITQITNIIYLRNFGLGGGNNIGETDYYLDSQSFFKRHVHYISKSNPVKLPVIKFSDYLKKYKIEKIDFLKIDTEGCEPDILLDDIQFIKNNVKYIQFEWANTWFDRNDNVVFIIFLYIFNLYSENFDFYFLYDEQHPLSIKNKDVLSSIKNEKNIREIHEYICAGYGLNIAMIRREL